jgi:hypothetical protein
MVAPGTGTALGALSAPAVKVVWHLAHLSFAPPGGMRLSSML